MTRSLWLVANRASGTHSAAALRAVIEGLAGAGRPPARILDLAGGLPRRAQLEQAGVDVLAVFGGDGTINAVATTLEGWGGALLPLPGGTANLLARALHGDRPAPAIAAGLTGLIPRRRPCIRTAHGTALAEVLAGPGARWSEVREGLRDGAVGAVAGTAMAAIRDSVAGPMVVLAQPARGHPAGYAGLLLTPQATGLNVAGYRSEGPADLIAQGVALLRRNFREGPHDALGAYRQVLVRALDEAPVALMIDGEPREGAREERFSLAPFVLDLLGTEP